MPKTTPPSLANILSDRFTDAFSDTAETHPLLQSMASRGSCRSFTEAPVAPHLLQTLSAVALSSPTKSDLQQRDIVLVTSAALRQRLSALVAGQPWVADAPVLAVFCGNNRRQRLLHAWRGVPFANDHLDAFFNASVDAGIALSAFVTAAEAIGLGCCPISAIRNEATAVCELLGLPDHVFPIAGLAIGYPDAPPVVSKRLPLSATVHIDGYTEDALKEHIATYDATRAATQPYQTQRDEKQFGTAAPYTWSEDKLRQYSRKERADFGAFIRAKGFCLD